MNAVRPISDVLNPKQVLLKAQKCGTCGEACDLMRIGYPPYAFERRLRCRCVRDEDARLEQAEKTRVFENRRASVENASFVPGRYAKANFENAPSTISADMKKVAFKAFKDIVASFPDLREGERGHEIIRYPIQSHGIVLVGDYGTGKTYAMAAMLNLACEKMIAGYLLNSTDFTKELRGSYNGDTLETESKVLGRYESIPILVLDDLDKFQATEWSCSILYNLLQSRCSEGRPTFVTSNYDAAQLLSETFGKFSNKGRGIIERIVENEWFEIRGKSVRRKISAKSPLQKAAE